MSGPGDKFVIIGRISGLYGVKGWVKIYSHTRPKSNLLKYRPWYIQQDGEWVPRQLEEGRSQGKGLVAKLEGCDDRDQAAELLERDIAIKRSQLPRAEKGAYYWSDLEGLRVFTLEGVELGVVDHLFETGANDVLVIQGERERLLPLLMDQVIKEVDLDAGLMRVDWDPEF
ncbi:MAG: ribosome maturation factor RimM [Gammaproteobacteria bacterium]|nr:ribosome maturation factor RimM [Gammaproteobacteria bacterium]